MGLRRQRGRQWQATGERPPALLRLRRPVAAMVPVPLNARHRPHGVQVRSLRRATQLTPLISPPTHRLAGYLRGRFDRVGGQAIVIPRISSRRRHPGPPGYVRRLQRPEIRRFRAGSTPLRAFLRNRLGPTVAAAIIPRSWALLASPSTLPCSGHG